MPAAAPPAEISSPMVREMFSYWQRQAAGRIAPRPRDIEPGDIKRLLPFISIADILREPFDLRFRLAGTGVVEATGYDFTGRRLSDMPITTGREAWTAHYARVASDKRPHYGRYRGNFGPELVRFVDQAAFPLSSDGSAVDRIIEIEDWSAFRGVGLARLEQSIWHFELLPADSTADKL